MGVGSEEQTASQHQIGQAKPREELGRVFFGQAAVARLAMVEEVLHHMERMLDLSPDTGFSIFDPFERIPPATPPAAYCACSDAWPSRIE